MEDPEVLPRVLSDGVPFLTTDGKILEHASSIPDAHPGILVLKSVRKHSMTEADIFEILAGFKAVLPGWNNESIENAIIEITQNSVNIIRVHGGVISSESYLSFTDSAWILKFREKLTECRS